MSVCILEDDDTSYRSSSDNIPIDSQISSFNDDGIFARIWPSGNNLISYVYLVFRTCSSSSSFGHEFDILVDSVLDIGTREGTNRIRTVSREHINRISTGRHTEDFDGLIDDS